MGNNPTTCGDRYQCPWCGSQEAALRQYESFRLHVFEECLCESCRKTWYSDRAGWTAIKIGIILFLPVAWGSFYWLTEGPLFDSFTANILTWSLMIAAASAGVMILRFGIVILSDAFSSPLQRLPRSASQLASESGTPQEWNAFIPKEWREPLAAGLFFAVMVLLAVTGNWPKDENGQFVPFRWKGRGPINNPPSPRRPDFQLPVQEDVKQVSTPDESAKAARDEEVRKKKLEDAKLIDELFGKPMPGDK